MPPESAAELLDRLKNSGLIPPERMPEVEDAADSHSAVADLTAHLRDGKLLTDYQIEVIVGEETPSLLIAARYEVRDKLGAGGMGEVYLAHDRQLDRPVALKMLNSSLVRDADAVARFEREAKAMARLEHPAIVRAYDSGSEGERHFLVMEYVDGTSVHGVLASSGQLEPPYAADYAYQTALGLEHAHGKELIHRDLKPSNLLIDKGGRIKILDLGLARFLQDQIDDETITVAGTGLGTPDYMSPEQFGNARHADERSDVYALGCTLYHMLAGRVPFPGSSLSQKQRDHQQKPPDPLESEAPNVPAGLTQAVYKMMAKKPAERFQSARECAEALTPYVAASSASLPNLSGTVEWEGSRLTIVTGEFRRRRIMKWSLVAAVIAIVGIGLGFGLAKLGGGDGDTENDNPGDSRIVAKSKTSSPAKTGAAKSGNVKKPAKSPKGDPWVLTVAQDGSGQFETINEALDNAKAGQSIRILDKGPYREQLVFDSRHQGITLESSVGATLELAKTAALISLDSAKDITIRGLKLRTATLDSGDLRANAPTLIQAIGQCTGLLFEDLSFDAKQAGSYIAVSFVNLTSSDRDAPNTIRRCHITRPFIGILIRGRLRPTEHVVVVGNTIDQSSNIAIQVDGDVRNVQIAGNQLLHSRGAGLAITDLSPKADDLLIGNNSFWDNSIGIAVSGRDPQGKDIRIRNNLILAPGRSDFLFVDGMTAKTGTPLTAGDAKLLHAKWSISDNWREFSRPVGETVFDRGWVTPSVADVLSKRIDVVTRETLSDDFLRPVADSKLATAGAGNTDPALPSYVGAIPPKGVPAWDWDRTWHAPPGKNRVLTVSKAPTDGGKYRTINAALKDAKPWDAIRVLDEETYIERIRLDDSKRHTGLTIESARGATIEATAPALSITGVPDVRVDGFRIRPPALAPATTIPLVFVRGRTAGVVLERLDLRLPNSAASVGVALIDIRTTTNEPPVVVRHCDFSTLNDALTMSGRILAAGDTPSGGILIHGNRLTSRTRTLHLQNSLKRVIVAANVVYDSGQAAIQLTDTGRNADNILIANNSMVGGGMLLRVFSEKPQWKLRKGQARITANVFSKCGFADMIAAMSTGGNRATASDTLATDVIRDWKFGHNWRDLSAPYASKALALSKTDRSIPDAPFISDDPSNADYLRPKPKSPLATGGVGGDLPKYAGAVPPKGTKRWDWSITWRSRMMRAKYRKQESSSSAELP